MPEPIAETYVEIRYDDVNKAQNAVDRFGRHVQTVGRDIETQSERMRRAFIGIGSAITAIGVGKFAGDVIHATTKMDSLNRMLVNVEGSQEGANKRFSEFMRLAKEPVLDPFNLSKYYTALKSVNVEGKLSIDLMKNLANAMAGVGASNQQFALAMEQFTQMAGKGKVMGDDLRAIANSFPQIRKYLTEAVGTAIPEEIAKKGYTAIEVMTKLNEVMSKAPKFAGGAQAAQDNFRQSLELFEAQLGKNVLPTVTKFLDRMTNMMDSFNELPEGMKKVIGTGGMIGTGLLGIVGALGAIYNLIGPVVKGLKEVAATKVATQGIAGASGMATGAGSAGALASIGKIAINAASVVVAAGTVLWAGKEIYNALTRDFTPDEKKNITEYGGKQQDRYYNQLQRYQMEAGNFPNKTLAEINPAGSDAVEGLINALGLDYAVWRDKTFAELEKAMGRGAVGRKQYATPAGPPEPLKPFNDAELLKQFGLDKLGAFDPTGARGMGKGSYAMYQAEGGRPVQVPQKTPESLASLYTPFANAPYQEPKFDFSNYFNKAVLGDIDGFTNSFDALTESFISSSHAWNDGKKKLAEFIETERSMAMMSADLDEKQQLQQEAMSNAVTGYMDGEVAAEDYAKALAWVAENTKDVEKETKKANKNISDLAKQIEEDWKDIAGAGKTSGIKSMTDELIIYMAQDIEYRFDDVWRKAFSGAKLEWKSLAQEMAVDFGGIAAKSITKDLSKGLLYGTGVGSALGITSGSSIFGALGLAQGFGSVVTALSPLVPILGVLGGFYASWKYARAEDKAEKLSANRVALQGGSIYPTTTGRRGAGYELYNTPGETAYAESEMRAEGGLRGTGKRDVESKPIPIEMFATGGVINKPTIAVMGEKGREYVFNESQMKAMRGGKIERVEIHNHINLPNATLDSVDQGQIDRFFDRAIPSIRRKIQQGALS